MPDDAASPAKPEFTREAAEAILQRLAGQAAPATDGATSPGPLPPFLKGEVPRESRPVAEPPTAAPSDAGPSVAADTFHGLIEAVPDALVVVGPDGRIILVNRQTERLFGYRRDELLGQPVEVLVPERFRERHVGERNAYFASPRERPMGKGLELFGRRKDGHEVPVEISLSPLLTDAGPLVVSSIRDISERKRSEALLRKMEARYRTLVEGIPAVTFMAALDEGVNELYVSPQIEELLGFTAKEWLENPILWYTQLHPDDRTRWHEEFARTCATGERFRSVYRFVARDGRVVWVHGEAQVVKDDDGRPLFLQGVAFDITGIKQAEEELMAFNQILEVRVAERTAEARQWAQELARSNEALTGFTGRVTHDLKEPLRSIRSFTQKLDGLAREQLTPDAQKVVTRILSATDRMDELIDDLLAYSRVGTHGKELAPTACDAALEGACANLHTAIEESGAEVTAAELPTVLADRTQLAQLFQNLIANALKFRANGRPSQIEVRAERRGEFWVLSVADNGIGIEAKYLQRIFGLGERLHSRREFPGHGIGLATCEKIVERHGGRIWCESPGPGQGSTFAFTLPAVP